MVASLEAVPPETRAAVIATPTPAHLSSAVEALNQGLAVLVEKPVTQTIGEARQLAEAAQGAGLPVRVGHHRRCHPFAQAARAARPWASRRGTMTCSTVS